MTEPISVEQVKVYMKRRELTKEDVTKAVNLALIEAAKQQDGFPLKVDLLQLEALIRNVANFQSYHFNGSLTTAIHSIFRGRWTVSSMIDNDGCLVGYQFTPVTAQ